MDRKRVYKDLVDAGADVLLDMMVRAKEKLVEEKAQAELEELQQRRVVQVQPTHQVAPPPVAGLLPNVTPPALPAPPGAVPLPVNRRVNRRSQMPKNAEPAEQPAEEKQDGGEEAGEKKL